MGPSHRLSIAAALVMACGGLVGCASPGGAPQGGGAVASSAPAPSAEEKQQDALMVKNARLTNAACDTAIPITIDWRDALLDQLGTHSTSGYCDDMLYSVRRLCEDSNGKKAVQSKIKAVSCGFGGAAGRTMALHDGILDYRIDFNSYNDADFAWEFLQNSL